MAAVKINRAEKRRETFSDIKKGRKYEQKFMRKSYCSVKQKRTPGEYNIR